MIKVVTIDFWDTIFKYPMSSDIFDKRVDFTFNFVKRFSISKERVVEVVASLFSYFQKIWDNERRTPSTYEMLSYAFNDCFKVPISDRDMICHVNFYEQLVSTQNLTLIDGVREALKYLSEKYKLIIISDTGFEPGSEIRKIMRNYDILKYFTYELFSNEVDCSKPDKKIFRLAYDKTGVSPEESVHIGDREDKDIIGAKNIGAKSIMFGGSRYDDYELSKADYKILNWNEIKDIL
ncbi:MAG: hypothetical protein CR982_00845 [Candidatus Cloacimonadota bacterium]|nr:MAG: hypothetical protein CR982_00845 [Candidatus Cloacimonadota bacterium]PIE78403.1 MAG: hypothetical protein CSA15_07995 [Candidatus Delongbacteria bacterium]